jgi:hypothetical protein
MVIQYFQSLGEGSIEKYKVELYTFSGIIIEED